MQPIPTGNKPTAAKGFIRLVRSFGYAFKGIGYAASTQLNFRVHVCAMLLVICLGVVLHISVAEWCCITICIGLVLAAELINTAIETLTDLVSLEYNEKAGRVKDVAAGAVLITAIFAVITGAIIFVPKLICLI